MAIKSYQAELRTDSPGVMAFARDLEYKEARVIEQVYPEKKAANGLMIQIEEVEMPWALSTSFRMTDGVGSFELADDFTTNLPFVDMVATEFKNDVKSYRSGYYYSEKEVAAFNHLGMPIDEQKIALVRKAYVQTLNRLILFGDRKTGMPGFVNHPAFLRSISPYKLDGSVGNANQLISALSFGMSAVSDSTIDALECDTIWLPRKQFTYLTSQARMDGALEKTVLKFFKENNTNPNVQIGWMRELEGCGPNGEDVALFYSRNPMYVKARITDPFRFRQLMVYPFMLYRPVAFDWNGIQVYNPYSVHVMIGV
jgi:hypothetical protein